MPSSFIILGKALLKVVRTGDDLAALHGGKSNISKEVSAGVLV